MSDRGLETSKNHPWATLDQFIQNVDLKIRKLANKNAQTAGASQLQIHLGLMELDTWKILQAKIERQVNTLRRLEENSATAKDEAKLQAHLANEDILSAAEETRNRVRRVERRLHNFKVMTESEAADALKRFSNVCSKLARRLEKAPAQKAVTTKVRRVLAH